MRTTELKSMNHRFLFKEFSFLSMKNSEGVLAEEQQERVKKDHRSNSAIDFKHLLYLIIFWME